MTISIQSKALSSACSSTCSRDYLQLWCWDKVPTSVLVDHLIQISTTKRGSQPSASSHQLQNKEFSKETRIFCVQTNANSLPEEKEQGIVCTLLQETRLILDLVCEIGEGQHGNKQKLSQQHSADFKGPEVLKSPTGNTWIETLPYLCFSKI